MSSNLATIKSIAWGLVEWGQISQEERDILEDYVKDELLDLGVHINKVFGEWKGFNNSTVNYNIWDGDTWMGSDSMIGTCQWVLRKYTVAMGW